MNLCHEEATGTKLNHAKRRDWHDVRKTNGKAHLKVWKGCGAAVSDEMLSVAASIRHLAGKLRRCEAVGSSTLVWQLRFQFGSVPVKDEEDEKEMVFVGPVTDSDNVVVISSVGVGGMVFVGVPEAVGEEERLIDRLFETVCVSVNDTDLDAVCDKLCDRESDLVSVTVTEPLLVALHNKAVDFSFAPAEREGEIKTPRPLHNNSDHSQ
eukprot:gene10939-biopygen3072